MIMFMLSTSGLSTISYQIYIHELVLNFLVEANNPWWTFFSYMFKPTCLGCSGICEVPAPEGCHCIKDTACMQQRLQAMGFPG